MLNNRQANLFLQLNLTGSTMNNYLLTLNTPTENGESLKVDLLNVKKAALIWGRLITN